MREIHRKKDEIVLSESYSMMAASPIQNQPRRRQSDPLSSLRTLTKDAEHSRGAEESAEKIKNELEFAAWYGCMSNGLLEASYDEYQYGAHASDQHQPG